MVAGGDSCGSKMVVGGEMVAGGRSLRREGDGCRGKMVAGRMAAGGMRLGDGCGANGRGGGGWLQWGRRRKLVNSKFKIPFEKMCQ
jgi:hypothetical protein